VGSPHSRRHVYYNLSKINLLSRYFNVQQSNIKKYPSFDFILRGDRSNPFSLLHVLKKQIPDLKKEGRNHAPDIPDEDLLNKYLLQHSSVGIVLFILSPALQSTRPSQCTSSQQLSARWVVFKWIGVASKQFELFHYNHSCIPLWVHLIRVWVLRKETWFVVFNVFTEVTPWISVALSCFL